ncbi:MAG: ceramide glucosyltransferase, partial [Acidobacteriaceae bacterium]|nr:ceramide glucosyltransferase [Acidobacteriaceae bacterium]
FQVGCKMMDFLLLLSIIGIITSTMYSLLVATGAVRLAQRRRTLPPGTFAPPVSLLKPLHGLEPDLESHLQSFFEQDYPEFEIIFCARTDQDVGLQIARRVAARYPKIRSRFLCSGNAPYANAKVWSLERMQNAASYRFFVVSDSDVSVTRDYLRAVMAPFADERVGLVTCLYRGVGNNFWSRLEGVGMSIEMSAGVLVAEMLEGMKFALGPTMVARRDCLDAAGGFRVLGPYHADDFILGNMIAAGGHRVVLSTHTIDHHVLNSSFLPSVLHQIRWMKSTRFSRPKGHLGTALTFSMPYGLLAAGIAIGLHRPLLGGWLLLWSWTSRVALGAIVGRLVVEEPKVWRSAFLYPLRDLLGSCYWVASYVSNQVRWRGEVYNLLQDGFMRNDSKAGERESEAILTA